VQVQTTVAAPSYPTGPATATWEALGTTALVRVCDGALIEPARAMLAAELDAIDLAASRFRTDSELERVNRGQGSFVPISGLLHEAIAAALSAAELTGGAVDPTLGEAIRVAGYDRDWHELTPPSPGAPAPAKPSHHRPARRWREVTLCDDPSGVHVPRGVQLDLGATAKALTADRAARAIHAATGTGVLVSLGGDIATAGPPPPGGWSVHVTDDHRAGPHAPGQTVTVADGGLATSSTTVRRWLHDGRAMHHILEPATGQPATGPWRTVSVAARSCLDANIASTAAIVMGAAAPKWLAGWSLPSRLVAQDGTIRTICGWPAEEA
jgi:thiamine biosynthesis lipoprotein